MKLLLIFSTLLFSYAVSAQTRYEIAMDEAMMLWSDGKSVEAAAKLERIAAVQKDEWHPAYHQALILITQSFSAHDVSTRKQLLLSANAIIQQKKHMGPSAEWLVLTALSLTSELTADPMNLGQKLSPKIISTYQTALKVDPENPRALSGLAEFQINTKKFTGGNTDKEYGDLQKALSLFQQSTKEDKYDPSWGRERAESLLNQRR